MKSVYIAAGGFRVPAVTVSYTELSSCLLYGPCLILQGKLILLPLSVLPGNWFPHLLHEGKLERFFFFLASLMMVNALGFWTIAHRYV